MASLGASHDWTSADMSTSGPSTKGNGPYTCDAAQAGSLRRNLRAPPAPGAQQTPCQSLSLMDEYRTTPAKTRVRGRLCMSVAGRLRRHHISLSVEDCRPATIRPSCERSAAAASRSSNAHRHHSKHVITRAGWNLNYSACPPVGFNDKANEHGAAAVDERIGVVAAKPSNPRSVRLF